MLTYIGAAAPLRLQHQQQQQQKIARANRTSKTEISDVPTAIPVPVSVHRPSLFSETSQN